MNEKTCFLSTQDVSVKDLDALIKRRTDVSEYSLSSAVVHNVLVYDASRVITAAQKNRQAVMAEFHKVLSDGPGVFVIKKAYRDLSIVDDQTVVFNALLKEESANGKVADHFAEAGANGRLWNALQKSALRDPAVFVKYNANPLLGLASESWLGTGWQLTSQVNIVPPGGKAQKPHRDYHLGFQTNDVAEGFPRSTHTLSSLLTLQGMIAHSDMPVESGPTLLLPYSHQYELGYLAWRDPDIIAYFDEHAVQLALEKGDMVFFNPALFHAAGTNTTQDVYRAANLVQVSSAFGKTMESIDREAMMNAVYPILLQMRNSEQLTEQEGEAVIQAVADGYSFPTNLDRDPPLDGLAPETEQAFMSRAIKECMDSACFAETLREIKARRSA
ncbi:phytanoyl-CoA dioxygenase family protein [Marinomonas mediterranea]|uniref:phytanoyl-CoA dioxygenase family protein n=1 Tax=Marinomonas mediterranea TaxID=119864 RepID=UPI00234B6AFD|nr:phytanoyl-CoA dioxygenase family protein [Marinomonas mediterranea]WCN08168.1 phytanoyl-CoA dioxygenase [Marinomonas mediterranea]